MVTSKRVSNAKSEKFYKSSLGKKKGASFWQGFKKQLSAHPLMIAFFFFIMIFSGVFAFVMQLPGQKRMYGGGSDE